MELTVQVFCTSDWDDIIKQVILQSHAESTASVWGSFKVKPISQSSNMK